MTARAPRSSEGLSLAVAFHAIAEAVPEREALVWRNDRRTWADLDRSSAQVATVLGQAGLGCRMERTDDTLAGWESGQDVVALFLYNGPEYLEAMLGSYKARCAPANVNFRSTPTELAYVLTDMSAGAVVFHASLGPTLALALQSVPEDRRPRVLLAVEDREPADRIADVGAALDYAATVRAAAPLDALTASPDDLYVLYTGGTTGRPKGVLWRQADFAVGALGFTLTDIETIVAGARKGEDRRVLPAPPFMHGAAQWFAWSAWLAGGTIVLPDDPGVWTRPTSWPPQRVRAWDRCRWWATRWPGHCWIT
jgi:3-oxocholest-4-en-26-oate---CoA ligase